MKKWFFLLTVSGILQAGETTSAHTPAVSSAPSVNKAQLEKHVKEQIKREENFARTQTFLKGDDYNLTEHQVDPPEYDFDMNDVYD